MSAAAPKSVNSSAPKTQNIACRIRHVSGEKKAIFHFDLYFHFSFSYIFAPSISALRCVLSVLNYERTKGAFTLFSNCVTP